MWGRSKIQYEVHVKVLSRIDGKLKVVAEAREPIQVMPTYLRWQNCHFPLVAQTSPAYEPLQSSAFNPPCTKKIAFAQKNLRKGFLRQSKGSLTVSVEIPGRFHLNVGNLEGNSFSLPVILRYFPVSADVPPRVRSLSARLYAITKYNVDSGIDFRNVNSYATTIPLLNASTPSTSTPLWLETPLRLCYLSLRACPFP